MSTGSEPVLRAGDHLVIRVEREEWEVEGLECPAGEWRVVVPEEQGGGEDLVLAVARVLTTLRAPAAGRLELLGQDPARLSYRQLQGLRRRIGLVQGWGGLLSNRTLRENVELPVVVHGHPQGRSAAAAAEELLQALGLASLADRLPHQVDRLVAFRARVARALIIEPAWLVVEGVGDWTPAGSAAWQVLTAAVAAGAAGAVCLVRPAPAFQEWLAGRRGRLAPCRRWRPTPTPGREEQG